MYKRIWFFLLAGLLLPSVAIADVTLLVHGYLANGITWDKNGIVAIMAGDGWYDGGPLVPGAMAPEVPVNKTLYVVDLPFYAPLMVQSDALQAQLEQAQRRHPGENITIVGHSAGGVVARMMLVRYGAQQVTHLITIASPHLGTPRAKFGLAITRDGPFNLVKEIAGGDTYDAAQESRALFVDLLPPRGPETALYWLNKQPHPDIDYTSVIRLDRDNIVPAASQDMNLVPALREKSMVYFTPGSHYLKAPDGFIINSILSNSRP